MSPKTEIQNKKIRENKKKLIMMTALELFASKSYHTTTINKIAKEAAISKGLLYNYFESKESLLRNIIINGMEEMSKVIYTGNDKSLSKKDMRNFVSKTFTQLQKNISFWKIYFSLLLQPSVLKIVEKDLFTFIEPFITIFIGFFKREGYENPIAEARFIAALLDGIGIHYILDPDNFPLKEALEKTYSIYSL